MIPFEYISKYIYFLLFIIITMLFFFYTFFIFHYDNFNPLPRNRRSELCIDESSLTEEDLVANVRYICVFVL